MRLLPNGNVLSSYFRPSCSLRNGCYKTNLQFCYFASRIKSSQCSFLVGNKVNFPIRKAQTVGVSCKSKKQGGALHTTCGADKILVANRGDIAVRVIRTAHEMGIPSVAVYSTADKDALHVKLADESVCIGEAPANEPYLDIPNVLSAAISHGCTMLHPGYGFLAENVLFVEICREHGINFIGPNPDSIRIMGDKSTARKIMKKAGVPILPGSFGLLQSTEEALKLAHEMGFPVLIKATVGGGGWVMRLAKEPDEFVKLLQQAKSDAAAAFGKDGVYLEKYVQNPRHIEFVVLADKYGNVVQFGELDCSIQRSNQKLLEEARSPALTPELRKAMGDAAVAAAATIGYIGVGMVKFLLDERGSFYFMEMNTLSQVEHPVSEMISSVDLIKEQIRVAMGERLRYKQEDIMLRGHSIESCINAEVSFKGFQTGTGRITSDLPSRGPFVSMDNYVNPDYMVPSSYDSLLGKIIQQAKLGVFDGKDRHVKSAPLLHTLSGTKMIGIAEELLLELNSKSLDFLPSESTLSALMLCFAENGLIPQALIVWDQLFNSSFVPDIQMVSQLFEALTKRRHFDKASEILVQLSSRNFDFLPKAYSLAISCFGSGGQLELMEKTIQEMTLLGFSVDPTVANSYVIYYSIYGSLNQMEAAYNRLKKSRYSIGEEGIRAMSLAYMKQRKFYQLGEFVRDVGLTRRNVGNLLWNLLLLSYAANFKMKTLQREFLRMIESGFHPDITTFNVRALAFSKMCLLWDLHISLEHMKREKVVPDLVTYGCVVDAYSDRRLGRNLDFALKKMNSNDSPIMLTDPFVFEVLGKGDFHSSSEAFLEFTKQKEWTYRKLIAVYMKKQYRRNQIFWNY